MHRNLSELLDKVVKRKSTNLIKIYGLKKIMMNTLHKKLNLQHFNNLILTQR